MTYFHMSLDVYIHYLAIEMFNCPAFKIWRTNYEIGLLNLGLKLEDLDLPYLFKLLYSKEIQDKLRAGMVKRQLLRGL